MAESIGYQQKLQTKGQQVSTQTNISADEPIVTISRILDAPREAVWNAFTDASWVAQWFGGEGFSNPLCEIDLRPGGLWRHVIRAQNGIEFSIDSIYLDVVEFERVAWKNAVDAGAVGGPPSVLQTVVFEGNDGATKLTVEATYESNDARDISLKMGFVEMVKQGLERLAMLLNSRVKSSAVM